MKIFVNLGSGVSPGRGKIIGNERPVGRDLSFCPEGVRELHIKPLVSIEITGYK